MEKATKETPVFLDKGETLLITDPQIVNSLARFFPGLGTGLKAFWCFSMSADLELVFRTDSGEDIRVDTNYEFWRSNLDQGPLNIQGDFLGFLRTFFAGIEAGREMGDKSKPECNATP